MNCITSVDISVNTYIVCRKFITWGWAVHWINHVKKVFLENIAYSIAFSQANQNYTIKIFYLSIEMKWLHMSCEVFIVLIVQIAHSRLHSHSLHWVSITTFLELVNNPTNCSPYILQHWRWSSMFRWKTCIHLQDYMVSQ